MNIENENENFENENENFAKEVIGNLRISNFIRGQRWVTLNGDFTSNELRDIANQIDKAFDSAFIKK